MDLGLLKRTEPYPRGGCYKVTLLLHHTTLSVTLQSAVSLRCTLEPHSPDPRFRVVVSVGGNEVVLHAIRPGGQLDEELGRVPLRHADAARALRGAQITLDELALAGLLPAHLVVPGLMGKIASTKYLLVTQE